MRIKAFPVFLLALCFYPFICLYSEYVSKQSYASLIPSFEDHDSTLHRQMVAAKREDDSTSYCLFSLHFHFMSLTK